MEGVGRENQIEARDASKEQDYSESYNHKTEHT